MNPLPNSQNEAGRESPLPRVRCHRPWTGFELTDHLGDVRPCCWGKVSCGNINANTPEQIWDGSGFAFYRERMLSGQIEDICNPWCPVLQDSYREASSIDLPPDENRTMALTTPKISPEYLRVVPTTACNLKCPMCYQADNPPPQLPTNLFAQLQPWIESAREMLVMGGETFLTRQCLEWVERIDPCTYPKCRLAAITNGLGFSVTVCELIARRQWSWILVSIDAASRRVYAKVRGGEFNALVAGLDRLAETRAKSGLNFEMRFGFTLQKSNLGDALAFLDLCGDYNAMPQYTLVFGDWHREALVNHQDYLRFLKVLEELDKRLWERGFGNQVVASALSALRTRHKNLAGPSSPRRPLARKATAPKLLADSILGRLLPAGAMSPINLMVMVTEVERGNRHLTITVSDNGQTAREFFRHLGQLQIDTYSIDIPFFDSQRKPISALRVFGVVEALRTFAEERGWQRRANTLDFEALGLDPEDSKLEYETLATLGDINECALSVISPIHDRKAELPYFIESLLRQRLDAPFEIILVDDGSVDGSIDLALKFVRQIAGGTRVKILRRHRRNRYKKGTFSFGAGLAREIGIRECEGERVLFLDPDQVVGSGCLQEHLDWGRRGFDVVIGDRTEDGIDVTSGWHKLRTEALNGCPDWWLSFFTGNSSVNRRLAVQVGGFDPNLQYWGLDDTDLGYRLYRAHASVWHTRRASVLHLDSDGSGGGVADDDRMQSYRLHMEVLYRKYLAAEILQAFTFVWPGVHD